MTSVDDYIIALSILIEDKKHVLGNLAIKKAQEIEGITVDDTGAVKSIEIDPKEALHRLTVCYKEVLGETVQ